MLLHRLKAYPSERRMPKPARQPPSCKHCFANVILAQAASWHCEACVHRRVRGWQRSARVPESVAHALAAARRWVQVVCR